MTKNKPDIKRMKIVNAKFLEDSKILRTGLDFSTKGNRNYMKFMYFGVNYDGYII